MNNPKDYHKTWSPKSTTRLSPKLKKLKKKKKINNTKELKKTLFNLFYVPIFLSILCSICPKNSSRLFFFFLPQTNAW